MKTTENTTLLQQAELQNHNDSQLADQAKLARPLRSLRPMKSMARIKSFKPSRIEVLTGKRRKSIKGL